MNPEIPPHILTSEPGSSAQKSFQVRIPRIIEDTLATNDFSAEIVRALRSLHDEIKSGVIAPLREDAPDRSFWDTHSEGYIGRSWLDVPWYWAESFFYRRMLEATRYFQSGAWHLRDPYANPKEAELAADRGPLSLQTLLRGLPSSPQERFRTLVHACVWGNRADLSYAIAANAPGSLAIESEQRNMILDDTDLLWKALHPPAGHIKRVDFILDNAGTELLFDFALADFLLQEDPTRQVVFHCKPQPFFVSDTMIKDARAALSVILGSPVPELRQLGGRLEAALTDCRWKWTDHWFWPTCLFFYEMPADLQSELAHSDWVISKGDANYRRWLGDAHWPPIAPFASVLDYFPRPLAALRTMKSELIVGLAPGQAERLFKEDPEWQVNGKRGVVQIKSEWYGGVRQSSTGPLVDAADGFKPSAQ